MRLIGLFPFLGDSHGGLSWELIQTIGAIEYAKNRKLELKTGEFLDGLCAVIGSVVAENSIPVESTVSLPRSRRTLFEHDDQPSK